MFDTNSIITVIGVKPSYEQPISGGLPYKDLPPDPEDENALSLMGLSAFFGLVVFGAATVFHETAVSHDLSYLELLKIIVNVIQN